MIRNQGFFRIRKTPLFLHAVNSMPRLDGREKETIEQEESLFLISEIIPKQSPAVFVLVAVNT